MKNRVVRTVETKERMYSHMEPAHVYDPTSFDPVDVSKALVAVAKQDRSDPFVAARAKAHMSVGITCPQDYLQ